MLLQQKSLQKRLLIFSIESKKLFSKPAMSYTTTCVFVLQNALRALVQCVASALGLNCIGDKYQSIVRKSPHFKDIKRLPLTQLAFLLLTNIFGYNTRSYVNQSNCFKIY